MIWPYLMGYSVAVMALALFVTDRWASQSSALVFGGFIGTRLLSSLFMGSHLAYVAPAVLWLIVAVAIPRQVGRNAPLVKGLLAASVMCYLLARVLGAVPVTGSWPFVISDALVVLATTIIGWRAGADAYDRISSLAWRIGGRLHSDSRQPAYLSGKAEKKVGRHGW